VDKFKVIDLFSGIGGFSLGLEATGHFETVAFCEIEEFPRKVLKKHWPDIPIYEDVKNVTAERLRTDGVISNGDRIVVTGGFPCQDISVAGHQKGITAERSGLWTELHRIIGELRPEYAIVENVSALLSGPSEQPGEWFGKILGDLAEIGFDARWYSIQAADMGAPHKRNRVWIVGYPECNGLVTAKIKRSIVTSSNNDKKRQNKTIESKGTSRSEYSKNVADSDSIERNEHETDKRDGKFKAQKISGNRSCLPRMGEWWATEPNVGRVANGIPNRVDRLKGLGNAIVPQIATLLADTIIRHESERNS
jgi:DNA (cytosine-5)-methyltransferase 1